MRRLGKVSFVALGLGVLLPLLPLVEARHAWSGAGQLSQEYDTPREHAWALARRAKAALRGAKNGELRQRRRHALELFESFAEAYPESGAMCAEAYFRIAEILRAANDLEGALKALEQAYRVEGGGDFVSRARYEAAHILRREGRLAEAQSMFHEVEIDSTAGLHRMNLASLWRAKSMLESGAHGPAERYLLELVKRVEDPVDRLRCYDELILLIAADQRIEAAVGYFARAKQSVQRESNERTRRGKRVRSALARMRSLGVLQGKIRKRLERE